MRIFSALRTKLFLPLLLVALAGSVVVINFTSNELSTPKYESGQPKTQNISSSDKRQPEVLGHSYDAPSIYIGSEYSSGGVVALASSDEPAIHITSYSISGTADVSIYQATPDHLLDYLLHDKEGQQIKKTVAVDQLPFVTSVKHEISKDYGKQSKLTLPISGTGIWYLQINISGISQSAFVIRSNTGVLVKEGDNEYIFWAQDFRNHRSITGGSLKIFNLTDGRSEIANLSFNEQGIATTSLNKDADIAFFDSGDDKAVTPVNLRYLNRDYNYESFQPKQRQTKYFIFTDRPLYRPGDTIYFKAVLRDDDDARYSVPRGKALVKVFKEGNEEEPVYEVNHTISADGTIHGEAQLSGDASTGYYTLRVGTTPGSENYNASSTYFQVEHFRKPEYSIEVGAEKRELIAQDKGTFKISGNYFFGFPLARQKVKYTIYSSDFYEYQYLTDRNYALSDDYRYGFWYSGKKVKEGEVALNDKGEMEVDFKAELPEGTTKSQVFSVEAEFDDGSGNPSFARKNILVYAGEFGIYRQDSSYSGKVGEKLTLQVTLAPNLNTNARLKDVDLTAKVHRESWVPYQEPDKKYPSYRKEEEDLPSLRAKTDSSGNASFSFTPSKEGSYKLTVEAKDERGNLVSKEFYFWVSREGQPFYSGEYNVGLSVRGDKDKYLPSDTARLTISSDLPNRDVLLTLERARVNRSQVVRISGKEAVVSLPLAETDMPNIFATVSSFSTTEFESNSANLIVSTESRKLVVDIVPKSAKFGPGDTVEVDVHTKDIGGSPVSAEVAVWAVDKAIFELSNTGPGDIFQIFWSERYQDTQTAHSLEGINILTAEGGGCFTPDTPVLMADGKSKKIKDVKAGDKVLTYKGESNLELTEATVAGTHSQTEGGYLVINDSLKITANHRLWVNDTWKETGSIEVGDTLLDFSGKKIVVSSIYWQAEKTDVYNLTVDKYRTYFAGGVWVHNQKGDGARSVFKDTAYWNPSVRTDSSGKAKITFKLPDNLTTWVIAGIGATVDTKVGQNKTEIVVGKDIVARPILPNIFRIGDSVVLSVLVHNFTDKNRTFDISLKFDAGEVRSGERKKVKIGAKSLEQLWWDLFPKEEKSNARVTLSAYSTDSDKTGDEVVKGIPVKKFGFWEKKAEVGNGSVTFKARLAKDSDPDKSKITLLLSPTVIGSLPSAMKYLIDYPYGCVEQTTSRFVPAIIAKENRELFGSTLADRDPEEVIRQGIKRLAQMKRSDGWAWWAHGESDPFVTAYVVEYLLRARELGFKIENRIFSEVKSYLEQDTVYDPETQASKLIPRDEAIARTYALSLLGSNKGKAELTDLDNAAADVLALAVITNARNGDNNPETNGLSRLLSMAQTQGDSIYWEAGPKERFGSNDASTALAIRSILAAGGDRELAVKAARYLTRNRKFDYWSNTFATSQVVRALTEVSHTEDELNPNYTYKVTVDGKEVARGAIDDVFKNAQVQILAKDIKSSGSDIAIVQSGTGQLYSTLVIDEFRTDRNAGEISNGMSIRREYINTRGKEYALAVGDTVEAKLTVGGLKTDENYMVIADELPAGMVPVNPNLDIQQQYGEPQSYTPAYSVTDMEVTENGIVLSLGSVAPGEHTYSYRARVVSAGEYTAPPANVSLMYTPEVNGRSEVQRVKILTKPQISPLNFIKKILPFVIVALLLGTVLVVVIVKLVRRRKDNQPPNLIQPTGTLTPEGNVAVNQQESKI